MSRPISRRNGRPVYLNLLRIGLPVMAVTSIGHRLSGLLLFLASPFLLYLFALSLSDPAGYARAGTLLTWWPVRLCGMLLLWWFAHHLLAGLRLLLADLDLWTQREASRRSAWAVNIAGLVAALLAVAFW